MQRRLSTSEIDALMALYREGASIDALARRYQVHRTTVIHHLDEAGIARRRVVRKMTDGSVASTWITPRLWTDPAVDHENTAIVHVARHAADRTAQVFR
ncbi:MAG: hypothetical protein FJW88_13935 [Actinobacteria bacterium]|nr:hypothetical protein [Actinomycetota bacterium]